MAEVELTLFTAAGMGLWVLFGLEAVLIIERLFCFCQAALTQHRGLFCFSHRRCSEEWGRHKGAGGDTARTANTSKEDSIKYSIVRSVESKGKEEEGVIFPRCDLPHLLDVHLPKSVLHTTAPHFLGAADSCSLMNAEQN